MSFLSSQIYMIVNDRAACYIGSTIQGIRQRLLKHESDYRGHTESNRKFRQYRSSFEVLKDGNYDIYLLETYDCCNSRQLLKREAQWLLKLQDHCDLVNLTLPISLDNQRLEASELLNIPINIKELLSIDYSV